MARIWQEGFEDGLPHVYYLEGTPDSQFVKDFNFDSNGFPARSRLGSGRNAISQKSLRTYIAPIASTNSTLTKTLGTSKDEVYFRVYFKHDKSAIGSSYDLKEIITLRDESGNKLISLYNTNITGADDWAIYAKTAGSYSKVADVTISASTWYKIDFYFKVSATVGAYEVKINNTSVVSDSADNTGTSNINSIVIGSTQNPTEVGKSYYVDDIALNDTSGSLNNSWCGDGTIVSLKPKGAGNYAQWDTCEGYATAEATTNTTTIKITGHGIASDGVIYNKTRDEYRIATVSDANTLTVSTVTGQTDGDIILLYDYSNTITNTIGTTTADDEYVVLVGHAVSASDVFVNTTRSNAIRKVIFVNGNSVYNQYDNPAVSGLDIGSSISTQADGDSIKTYSFLPYAITNHWEAVSNQDDPSPKQSYIKTTTLNDIDTFDMEELTSDKSIPAGASIVAISHNTYAKEAGAGSEFKPVFRISSTDYAGDTIGLSGGTLQYQEIYNLSPATSSEWTRSEVDGLEAGVKLV